MYFLIPLLINFRGTVHFAVAYQHGTTLKIRHETMIAQHLHVMGFLDNPNGQQKSSHSINGVIVLAFNYP